MTVWICVFMCIVPRGRLAFHAACISTSRPIFRLWLQIYSDPDQYKSFTEREYVLHWQSEHQVLLDTPTQLEGFFITHVYIEEQYRRHHKTIRRCVHAFDWYGMYLMEKIQFNSIVWIFKLFKY